MCHAGMEPKFVTRDIEARLRFSAHNVLQDRDKSPQIPPPRLAALRVWWQRRLMAMLRKDVGHV